MRKTPKWMGVLLALTIWAGMTGCDQTASERPQPPATSPSDSIEKPPM